MTKRPSDSNAVLIAEHYVFEELWRILETVGDKTESAVESSGLSVQDVNEMFLRGLSRLFRPFEIHTFAERTKRYEHFMAYKKGRAIEVEPEGLKEKVTDLIKTAERVPFEPLGKMELNNSRVWIIEILATRMKPTRDSDKFPCVAIVQKNGEPLGLKKHAGLNIEDLVTTPNLKAFEATYDTCLKLALSFKDLKESENKRTIAKLETAQRYEALGLLAGGIAHDFNNILTPIIGFSDIIIDRVHVDYNDLREDAKEIKKAGVRATDLVKQILCFCRESDEKSEPVKIRKICKEVLKLLRATLPATIEIRHEFVETNPVLANPTSIYQILMNLCTNAYHAMMDNGGVLQVTLTNGPDAGEMETLKKRQFIKLSVIDSGDGMDPGIIHRIFDCGFTTKKRGKGTGFGLHLVKDIVHKLGGKIFVDSEKGRGSTFDIYLPTVDEVIEEASHSAGSAPLGDECILFVDDEIELVNLGDEILRGLGYKVVPKNSSIDALKAFREKPDKFNLVVTDMTMPNMTGVQLSMALLKIKHDIPIILSTGFSDKVVEKDAETMGIREFIMKPFDRKKLACIVRQVLDRKKQCRETTPVLAGSC